MSSYPHQRYPSPRPVLSLEEFIDFFASADPYSWPDAMDHFETRATCAEYCFWILSEPKRWLLDRMTLAEAANVLHTMPRPSGNPRLPEDLRLDILRANINVFREVFEPLVGTSTDEGAAHLAEVCFMWWDNCAWEDPGRADIFREVVKILLKSPNAKVREAALHGLGHHIGITGDKLAVHLIDEYLRSGVTVSNEEIKYAKEARRGNVL